MSQTIRLIIIFLLVTPCKKEIEIPGYKKIEFNEEITKNQIFKDLNNLPEFDFKYRFRKIAKNQKRSTNLEIKTELGGLKNVYNEFNSESFFLNDMDEKPTDTLIIMIDNFDGYSGNGLSLRIYNNFFKTEYIETGDVVIQNKKKDNIKIIESNLILNKKRNKINDSVFGFIKLEMIKNKESVIAEGFFRTIIKKREF